MHLSLLSLSFSVALAGVRAQLLPPQVTPCIQNCALQAVAQDLDGCSVNDVKCLCANKKIQQDMFNCLQQQCTTQELEEVQVVIAAECAPPASSTSTTHSAAPSTSPSTSPSPSPSTHPATSSEARTSEKTSASSTTTVPSTHLSSIMSVSATSLANSTSLLSSTSTMPVTLSSSSPLSSSSSDTSSTTPSAAPASTNAALRVGQDANPMSIVILGALLGSVALW